MREGEKHVTFDVYLNLQYICFYIRRAELRLYSAAATESHFLELLALRSLCHHPQTARNLLTSTGSKQSRLACNPRIPDPPSPWTTRLIAARRQQR